MLCLLIDITIIKFKSLRIQTPYNHEHSFDLNRQIMILNVAPEFGYTLITAVAVAFEVILIGFLFPGRFRAKVFNEKFMKEHFKDAPKGGYPDMGCGRYAAKLSDEDWLLFNNAQRAHYNFVEGVATYILLILVSGLYYPLYATYLGIAIFIGRLLFSIGYVSKGPNGRLIGALLVDFGLLGLVVLSVMSGLNVTKGKSS